MRKNRGNLLNVIILILFILSYTGFHVESVYAEPEAVSVADEVSATEDNILGDTISAGSTASDDGTGIVSEEGTVFADGTGSAGGTDTTDSTGSAGGADSADRTDPAGGTDTADSTGPAGDTASAGGTISAAGTANADETAPAADAAPAEDAGDITVTTEAMNDEEGAQIADNGIPVINLVIDPAEYQAVINSDDHSYRAENCSLQITAPDKWESEYGSGDTSIFSKDLALDYIRGRGNSTWIEEKKPFKFKLSNKTDLFGMGSNKHWVLMANAMDHTYLKNRITSYISKRFGMPFTPEFVPVDFYVNGEYQGSYVLGHQVRVDENRVEIDKLTSADLNEPEITGGYLIAMNPYDNENPKNKFTTEKGVEFFLNTPSFGSDDPEETVGPKEQRDYITNYLQKVENAIFAEDFTDEDGIRYSDYMDLNSAARYWWVQEFSGNGDGFLTSSTYLYKERSGKLYWGPLWDFDLAYDAPMEQVESLNNRHMAWLDYMRAYDPQYQEILRSVWEEFDQILQDITCDGGILDQYRDELRASAAQDIAKWGGDSVTDFDENVEELRTWIENRRGYVNSVIDTDLTKVYVTASFEVDGELIHTENVRMGEHCPDEEIPEAPDRDGYYFTNWVSKDTGEPVSNIQMDADTVFIPEYIPYEEAIEPKAIYFAQEEVWADINQKTYVPNWNVAPLNATVTQISWSSSDSGVADALAGGKIKLVELGTAVIKATLKNGISKKLTLHVYDPDQETIAPPESLTLASDHLVLKPDAYGQIPVTLSPFAADFYLMFSTDDEEVALVEENGMVHALSPGTCKITIQEYKHDLYAEYTVTVVDNSEELIQAKNELAEKIISAKRDLSAGTYTEESLTALNTAIEEANGVIDNRDATESEILIAKTRLLRAWRRLEAADDAGADDRDSAEEKNRHDAIDALAETLISMYDMNFDSYRAADVKAFKELLAKGDQVLADPDADTASLREARTNILIARKNLKKKSANTLTVKGRTIKVKGKKSGAKTVLKKTKKFKKAKAFKISKAVGKVTFKKMSGNKKITISKAGKVTLKKGLKKGTYKVKVSVTAAGDGNYNKVVKTVTLKVKVK